MPLELLNESIPMFLYNYYKMSIYSERTTVKCTVITPDFSKPLIDIERGCNREAKKSEENYNKVLN